MEQVDKENLARLVRRYRGEERINQTEFAEKCDTKQRTISYLETENWARISEEALTKIKDVLEFLTGWRL